MKTLYEKLISDLKKKSDPLEAISRTALQRILSKLKDMISDVAAHSEITALFHISKLMSTEEGKIEGPIVFVTYLDMCYQCEKACVTILPTIINTCSISINGTKLNPSILVGSYEPYSNDGKGPRNTRNRIEDGNPSLIKIALTKEKDKPIQNSIPEKK